MREVLCFWQALLTDDPEGNAEFFSPARVVARFKHLPAFAQVVPQMRALYESAHSQGNPTARAPVTLVFRDYPTHP